MKKVLPLIVMGFLGMSATVSYADDSALKLATIKGMYSQAKPENNEYTGSQYENLFTKYSSLLIKQASEQIKKLVVVQKVC